MIGPKPPTGPMISMMQTSGLEIRAANPADVPLILSLINELAEYEKLRHESVATDASIHRALFGPKPHAEAVIARFDGEIAGFALFFHNFSTFLGKPGLYLEDLFVRPEYRGRSIGKSLLSHLAALAVQRDCGRFQWQVLDWNKPSREFYESLGAQADPTWITYRMTGEALQRLAQSSRSGLPR
jgi:GNAT superfamily N-acetyltransferase